MLPISRSTSLLPSAQKENDPRPTVEDSADSGVFFARQMIENACATQAIINCLLNCSQIDVGADLAAYREFTSGAFELRRLLEALCL